LTWAERAGRWLVATGQARGPVVAAVLLCLPALWVGTGLDDDLQRLMVDPGQPLAWVRRPPWDLFSFVPRDPGQLRDYIERLGIGPWWTSPDAHLRFGRPLSSLLAWLDYRVLRLPVWVAHLHSLAWLGCCVAAVAALYRGTLAAPAAAIAVWMFALEDGHAVPAGWLANRNSLVATTFAALALLAHLRWRGLAAGATRRRGHPGWLVASLAALLAGLLAGEAALGISAYLFSFALLVDDDTRLRRAASLLPAALVCVGWRVGYVVLGFGAHGSGLYVDPGGDPLGFAGALVEHYGVLWLGQVLPLPSDPWMLLPDGIRQGWSLVGAVATVGFAVWAWRSLRGDRVGRAWLLGALVAAIPMCATAPADRLLLPVGIGFFAVVARLLTRAEAPWPRWAGLALAVHVGFAALLLPVRVGAVRLLSHHLDAARDSMPPEAAEPGRILVVVQAGDMFQSNYLPAWRVSAGLQPPERIAMLAMGLQPTRVTRRDAHTLVFEREGGFLTSRFDYIVRDPDARFEPGWSQPIPGAVVTVVAVTGDGRPLRFEARFEAALEDRRHVWVVGALAGFERFVPPAVGETVTVSVRRE
jgi:hypothetical protein